MSENKGKTSMGIDPKAAGLLCYMLGWVTGLIFLILEKEDKFVRFHAIQSIITFGAITVVYIIFFWVHFFWILWLLSLVLWVVLMYKAYQGEKYKLPVLGDIAEKNA
jgi:uncharacterized membrane protein